MSRMFNMLSGTVAARSEPAASAPRPTIASVPEPREEDDEGGPRVLRCTAPAAAAGTTSVLLNLAITLAREEAPRILAIDGNTGKPGIARMFAVKPTPGLAEVLAKQVPLAWAVQATMVPNLQVLAAGAATGQTPATIAEDFPKLIEQLRQWYDWVLID